MNKTPGITEFPFWWKKKKKKKDFQIYQIYLHDFIIIN